MDAGNPEAVPHEREVGYGEIGPETAFEDITREKWARVYKSPYKQEGEFMLRTLRKFPSDHSSDDVRA